MPVMVMWYEVCEEYIIEARFIIRFVALYLKYRI